MKKNNTLKLVLTVIGAVVVIAAAVAAVIHFWEDIKKYLPCKKKEEEFEDFDDIEIIEE